MFEVATISLIGNRKTNQDRCLVLRDERSVFLLLADGLGGHPKGEVAAQILMDIGQAAFAASPKPISDPQDFLEEVLHTAHKKIVAFGCQHQPPITPRTTAVLALIQMGYLFWTHVGDSRIYLLRARKIAMRSRDHSILEAINSSSQAAEQNVDKKRYRNMVTHCLGSTRKVLVTQKNRPIPLRSLDVVALCSDGLWGQFNDKILGMCINDHNPLEPLTNKLAQKATQTAAPNSDNVTLILLRWLGNLAGKSKLPPAMQTERSPIISKPTTDEQDPKLQEAINTLLSAIDEFSSK